MEIIPKGEPVSILYWSSEYIVNIPAIDNEHKLLVSIINDLAHSMHLQNSFQAEVATESLHRLSNCICTHFESEERFLLSNNYPE
jgi:hemerythrin-like metal-binding protein